MQRIRHRRNRFDRSRPLDGSLVGRGFTLIELIIVMAIVAILASVALPSYRDHVLRGHRAAAQATLLDVAARQRQFLIDRRAFAATTAELGMALPDAVTTRYTVTVETVANVLPPRFRLVATPTSPQAGDRCGTLSLDDTGARLPAGCW